MKMLLKNLTDDKKLLNRLSHFLELHPISNSTTHELMRKTHSSVGAAVMKLWSKLLCEQILVLCRAPIIASGKLCETPNQTRIVKHRSSLRKGTDSRTRKFHLQALNA